MCATILWAVNQAAFTPRFQTETERRLGVAPQPTTLRIASARVRPTAEHFTLMKLMCECRALVGLADDALGDGEIPAEDLVAWVRDLPEFAPHATRLAILRSWSPDDGAIVPERAASATADEVDEHMLRGVRDETLLTVDYPRG